MDKKGLCCTCISDKECSFPRRFPVIQCEEFDNTAAKPLKKQKRQGRR